MSAELGLKHMHVSTKGMTLAAMVSPHVTSSFPIFFSHFFDSWKQHWSGEGG
ncbi:MAG TPA: hypothetical protein VKR59_10800 [Terriglobales bacterium]|nr:hypothetical protein [Terriglobales bacterium]